MPARFKSGMNAESLNLEAIFKIIVNFDPSKDQYCESISLPKNGDLYLHFSNDHEKFGDWKSDGMSWANKGQKEVNINSDPLYRTLYHLRLGPVHSTNKFSKRIFQIPGSLSPTLVWYEGDEKLCVPLPHGNSNNPNRVYSRSKPSDVR